MCLFHFTRHFYNIFSWHYYYFFVFLTWRSIGTHSHLSLATSVGNRSVTSMWRERYTLFRTFFFCLIFISSDYYYYFFIFCLLFLLFLGVYILKKTLSMRIKNNFLFKRTNVESQVNNIFYYLHSGWKYSDDTSKRNWEFL